MSPVTAVTVRVPAKVNLQLAVGPVRADGYHDLVTVFHAVSLFDDVTVAPAARDSVAVTGEGAASVPTGDSNLAVRAARALAEVAGSAGREAPGLAIRIRKRIPVAAGLAGGSADAAATLVACNLLWQVGLSQQELAELAADIGSDVTFALVGGTAVGVGQGEQVTQALTSGTYHWVLAFAHTGLSTAEVYAALDRIRAAGGDRRTRAAAMGPADAAGPNAAGPGGAGRLALDTALMTALRSGDPTGLGPLLANDLQPAAISLHPELRRTLAAGVEFGALGALVCGSGPTCAFLARSARHARDLAVAIAGAGVCRTVARVTGPAAGASVRAGRARP